MRTPRPAASKRRTCIRDAASELAGSASAGSSRDSIHPSGGRAFACDGRSSSGMATTASILNVTSLWAGGSVASHMDSLSSVSRNSASSCGEGAHAPGGVRDWPTAGGGGNAACGPPRRALAAHVRPPRRPWWRVGGRTAMRIEGNRTSRGRRGPDRLRSAKAWPRRTRLKGTPLDGRPGGVSQL